MLKRMLELYDGMLRTGLSWLRIQSGGGLCKHGDEPLGIHKVVGNSSMVL
jgi:hypothetical protein